MVPATTAAATELDHSITFRARFEPLNVEISLSSQ